MAQEMGYMPNAVAQSLRGERTHTIGLVVTTIADPFVGRVVRGVEAVAHQYNLSLFLSVSNNDPDREWMVIENFHRRRVDGIIVAATPAWLRSTPRACSASISPRSDQPAGRIPARAPARRLS
jgi:DNA-binding LacI/PurR family transcriptional regulator